MCYSECFCKVNTLKKYFKRSHDFNAATWNCAISIYEKKREEITKMLEDLANCSNILKQYIYEGYRKRDHGVISALIVRNIFGLNWRDSFILPGIQAMAIHNLKKKAVKFTENPIAFLLMLCDEIQERDRPSRMWGHFQLINPLKSIKIKTEVRNNLIKLGIKYDFAKNDIIDEIARYEDDFYLEEDISNVGGKRLKRWSEEEFAKVKRDDLRKKLSCEDIFKIELEIKTRKKNIIRIIEIDL